MVKFHKPMTRMIKQQSFMKLNSHHLRWRKKTTNRKEFPERLKFWEPRDLGMLDCVSFYVFVTDPHKLQLGNVCLWFVVFPCSSSMILPYQFKIKITLLSLCILPERCTQHKQAKAKCQKLHRYRCQTLYNDSYIY